MSALRWRRWLFWMLSAATAVARAQTAEPAPPPPAPPNAQRIEITGGRASDTEQRRQSTAAKIVIGREEIERFGDSNTLEVLKRLPGVTIPGAPGRGGNPRLRGMGGGFTQILIDGERIAPGFALDSIPPEQIERIEILRAPTAETGARAIAGTINIVLREGFRKKVNDVNVDLQTEAGKVSGGLAWTRNDSFGSDWVLEQFAVDVPAPLHQRKHVAAHRRGQRQRRRRARARRHVAQCQRAAGPARHGAPAMARRGRPELPAQPDADRQQADHERGRHLDQRAARLCEQPDRQRWPLHDAASQRQLQPPPGRQRPASGMACRRQPRALARRQRPARVRRRGRAAAHASTRAPRTAIAAPRWA